ncbi:MAG: leucyl/phenylalanyl-tRNA--protein transferase [Nocardioides sp.]
MAEEPPATPWLFPVAEQWPDDDLIALGADLEPGTLLSAYRSGLFPMPMSRRGEIGWFSPRVRGVLPLGGLRVSKSLRRSVREFEIRVDTAFVQVVLACADPSREGSWIDDDIIAAYADLHELGWAHSVEAWQHDHLVGGLYGVSIGGLFAGESMFHHARDASKVALVGLVDLLNGAGAMLLDVQWSTPHLESLGVIEIDRSDYLGQLGVAVTQPQAEWKWSRFGCGS